MLLVFVTLAGTACSDREPLPNREKPSTTYEILSYTPTPTPAPLTRDEFARTVELTRDLPPLEDLCEAFDDEESNWGDLTVQKAYIDMCEIWRYLSTTDYATVVITKSGKGETVDDWYIEFIEPGESLGTSDKDATYTGLTPLPTYTPAPRIIPVIGVEKKEIVEVEKVVVHTVVVTATPSPMPTGKPDPTVVPARPAPTAATVAATTAAAVPTEVPARPAPTPRSEKVAKAAAATVEPVAATVQPDPTATASGEAEIAAGLRLTATLRITEQDFAIYSIESLDWSDASLGCPKTGHSYAQVITPGYRIIFDVQGVHYRVHTNLDGSVTVLCNETTTATPVPAATAVPSSPTTPTPVTVQSY